MPSADSLVGKSILVTGGAGFIGSHLCRSLLHSDCQVIGLDNFCDYYDPAIKALNISDLDPHPQFTLFKADIRDGEALRMIFSNHQIDAVVHLAAMAGVQPSIKDPLLYNEVNVMGTATLLELCREFKTSKFIFASSSSVYGNNKEVPFSEDMSVDNPISPYAATKKAGELMCHTWHHLYGLDVICLRFFTVYGPGQRPDLAISKFIAAIHHDQEIMMYGDGTSSRDYTYIDDIVEGVINSLGYVLNHKNIYEIINLGNSTPITLCEMIRVIADQMHKPGRITRAPEMPGDVFTTFADIRKAKKLLDYVPRVPFEIGIIKQIEAYRACQ